MVTMSMVMGMTTMREKQEINERSEIEANGENRNGNETRTEKTPIHQETEQDAGIQTRGAEMGLRGGRDMSRQGPQV